MVFPAPLAIMIGFIAKSIRIVNTIDTMMESTIPCNPALLALAGSSPPMYLAIRELAPAPIPCPRPISTINKGVIKPIAANASEPSPATHMLSQGYTSLSKP